MENYDLIIIGGGAAGLMSAGTAAELGLKVLMIEKMEKPARKVRITGKGRCNITNTKQHDDFLQKVFPDNRFFEPALRNFSNFDTITFFEKLGLKTVTERGERVFPASGKAWDVAECLIKWAKNSGTEILCNTKVIKLNIENNKITSVLAENNGQKTIFCAKYFLITTGGLSYPATGSTGDGYDFAKEAGHKIINTRPSLVPLEIKNYDAALNKLNLRNVTLSLYIDGGCAAQEFGEMEFTNSGAGGAIVLRVSRMAVDALNAVKKVELSIDFKSALTKEQLQSRIAREFEENGILDTKKLLQKLLPMQIVEIFADKANVSLQKKPDNYAIEQIIKTLKDFRMIVKAYRPYTEAIVTAGGVSLKEIDRKTMKSKLIQNLYFAGEVIDLDANTGGYNLQIAFSTARLAAQSIAKNNAQ